MAEYEVVSRLYFLLGQSSEDMQFSSDEYAPDLHPPFLDAIPPHPPVVVYAGYGPHVVKHAVPRQIRTLM